MFKKNHPKPKNAHSFPNGHTPWNKGKKGITNSGSFKKGCKKSSNWKKAMEKLKGKNNSSWKGGKTKNSLGYVFIYKPRHPFHDNKNYVREHRLVMERKLGRYLKSSEIIHHINCNPSDNRIENLKILTRNKHQILHRFLNYDAA